MPKKNLLPDYSRANFGYTHEYFSVDKAATLKRRFGFRDDFDLHAGLKEATFWWQVAGDPGDAPTSVRKTELQELNRRAQDLLESLRKLGNHARLSIAMADNSARPHLDGQTLSTLKLTLRKLVWTSRNAVARLPAAKAGRRPNDALDLFLLHIRSAYRQGTGQRDVAGHDYSWNRYTGNFFGFTRECLQTIGLRKSDAQYAMLAKQAASYDDHIDRWAANDLDDFERLCSDAWDEVE